MKCIYLIKDLAKVSGCSTHTLKFYLRMGLLKEIGRSPETNFRYFDDSSYKRLRTIRELQRKNLSLKEIHQKLEGKKSIKKILFPMVLLGALMIVFEPAAWAQEPQALPEEDEFLLFVDQALDQVEETFNQTTEEASSAEIAVPENLPSAPDADASATIEILEEVNLASGAEAEKGPETKVIPLLYAEASGIMASLHQMKSSTGEITYNEENHTLILKDMPEQLEAMSAFVKEVDILLETEVFKLEYAKAQDIIGQVTEVLTKSVGQAEVNIEDNSIMATDTPLTIGKIQEIIMKLDRVNKAVKIETKILQIVLNDEHATGVDWEAIVSDHQSYQFPGFTSKANLSDAGQLNMGVVSREDYDILLDALDTVGVVREISDDIIIAKSEETRTISILPLREVPSKNSNSGEDGKIIEADHPVGISPVRVEYHLSTMIHRDGVLTAVIKPEIIGGPTDQSGKASEGNAEVQAKDGSTIVIGSLFDEVLVESAWKVPLLGDLPLLGFVFRNQGEELRTAEIITFLTITTVEKE